MENNTNFELPEGWFQDLRYMFGIQSNSKDLEGKLKPIVSGLAKNILIADAAGKSPYLMHKIAEIAEQHKQHIVVVDSDDAILAEMANFAQKANEIIVSDTFFNAEITKPTLLQKPSNNSKGKPKQNKSKYF